MSSKNLDGEGRTKREKRKRVRQAMREAAWWVIMLLRVGNGLLQLIIIIKQFQ